MTKIHPQASIAKDATVEGDVTLGPGVRIRPGARVIAEKDSSITIGENTIVMENAVVRATARHDTVIGSHVLIGPQTHIVGATIADEVFVATGASVFHGAKIGKGSEIRINAVVHLRSRLPPGTTVPIGWVAVGDPLKILSPDQHDAIWSAQAPLDFPGFVYGLERSRSDLIVALTQQLSKELG
jgi:carbonic anhydrase/acetyltransferase-like protein (isoleucine patch superfamily)